MMGIFCWSIIFTGAAPSAFRNIGWRFYIVFAAATLMMLVIVFFFFPEVWPGPTPSVSETSVLT